MIWLYLGIGALLVAALLYWLLVITEGVFLGRKVVVWLYDITAGRYDSIKRFDSELEWLFVAVPLVRALSRVKSPLILDVAAGTGRVAAALLRDSAFDGRIVMVEPSTRMLVEAEEKIRNRFPDKIDRVEFVHHQAAPLPLPDNHFDAASCLEALEFMPSDWEALAEMARVLKPGGFLFTTRRKGWEAATFLGRARNRATFKAMLEELGFDSVRFQSWQVNYELASARKIDPIGQRQPGRRT